MVITQLQTSKLLQLCWICKSPGISQLPFTVWQSYQGKKADPISPEKQMSKHFEMVIFVRIENTMGFWAAVWTAKLWLIIHSQYQPVETQTFRSEFLCDASPLEGAVPKSAVSQGDTSKQGRASHQRSAGVKGRKGNPAVLFSSPAQLLPNGWVRCWSCGIRLKALTPTEHCLASVSDLQKIIWGKHRK